MYGVVLLAALTAGGEAGALGGHSGNWWYAPLPYIDEPWPAGIHYAPSPARLAPGGRIGPTLEEAMRWLGSGEAPLSDGERKEWEEYYKALTFEEQAEVGPLWRSADLASQRRLLAQVAAMRGKKAKDKEADN